MNPTLSGGPLAAASTPHALTVAEALAALHDLVSPIQASETVPLFEALDRVLAQDLVSPIDVPPHDNAAMDGYALQGKALHGQQPTRLRIVGTVMAGQTWQGGLTEPGDCVRIMTGAPMPPGLDTVAPQEMTTLDAQGTHITVAPGQLQSGEHRRLRGEDLRAGGVALAKGCRLAPAELGLLASLGQAEVAVLRRPRVAILSTGDEILRVGEAVRPGAIYDSNRATLFGLLRRLGVDVLDLGVVSDDPVALATRFQAAADQADVVISSGGVSVGEADHTRTLLQSLGTVAFWRIAMRPGRPMAVGTLARSRSQAKSASRPMLEGSDSYIRYSEQPTGNALFLGLPGNPVAVMVTFLALVRPTLLRLMGCTRPAAPLLQARSATALRKKAGRTEYQRGRIERNAQGGLDVRTTGQQGSGVLSSMVQANGLIVLHHDQGPVAPGDPVEVMVFDGVL